MLSAFALSFVAGFFCSLVYVALKSFQQLSVVHDKYLWILPCSMAMALCDTFTTKIIVANSVWIFIPLGVGGGLGCLASMKIHERLRG